MIITLITKTIPSTRCSRLGLHHIAPFEMCVIGCALDPWPKCGTRCSISYWTLIQNLCGSPDKAWPGLIPWWRWLWPLWVTAAPGAPAVPRPAFVCEVKSEINLFFIRKICDFQSNTEYIIREEMMMINATHLPCVLPMPSVSYSHFHWGCSRAVESESLKVWKSLKVGKSRIKSEKSDLIFY